MSRHRSGARRARYAVRNWPAYDRALIRRGELTIWISPSALGAWRGGGGRLYSDAAIEAALTVRAVFRLALRRTEGLVGSIFGMLGLSLPVPDHTTLSRRGRHLETDRRADAGDGIDLVIDSTGLQLWRRGSPPGRTGWRKLHIAIDPNTGTILAQALTDGDAHDTQAVPELLSRIDGRIGRVNGDGAHDGAPTYRLLADRHQALPIPQGMFRPRTPSIVVADEVDPLGQRGRHLRFIARYGRRAWERDTGYGGRNLVEATFPRLKRVLGNRLRGRSLPAQQSEASIVTRALNRMTELGMPVTERVA